MENQDKLHEQFKEAAGKAEDKGFARMDAVWNRVEEKLDNKKQRRIATMWKYTGIAALFLLFMGVGIFMLDNEQHNPITAPHATPENTVTAIDTQKVKETFDPAKAVEKEAVVVNDAVQPDNEQAAPVNTSVIADSISFNTATKKALTWRKRNDKGAFNTKGEIVKAAAPASAYADAAPAKAKETSNISVDIEKRALIQGADASITSAQEKDKISGVITDSQGLPVPGVNVIVEGTRNGVQTDFDGKYMIDAKEGEKIVASYIGMETQAVTLGKSKKVDFALEDDSNTLEEVVVQGYRSTTRATSNIAVTTVTSKTIEGRPNANFVQTLQGQVPGISITNGAGQPGTKTMVDNVPAPLALPFAFFPTESDKLSNGTLIKRALPVADEQSGTVVLRGIGSINGDPEPLYVVDGVPLNAENFKSIDTNDILDVKVIKDAGATSIYGNRGANGVIIVKTKSGLAKQQLTPVTTEEEQNDEDEREIEVDDSEDGSFIENQFENTATTPLSTFSIDVDNASYTSIRRYLNDGETVPKDEVRVEEMINFFKYDYPQPKGKEPFSINTEYSDAPWNPQHKLLRIGLQGKIIEDNNLPASNFVFLIDVSGSMEDDEKLPLLKQSMKLLVNQMRKKDKIAIVVYAGAAGLVLPPTSGDQKETIIAALEKLEAGGSTAGGEGIELAYKTAQENFVKNGNNRVILATDGDFNVGASSDDDMETLIEQKRKSGVFLTCLGYGMGNYKDSKMEILADKGNGNYAYIDSMQEANRYLSKEFKGSMYAIAKDVKIQIEFNPAHVQSYRLIGYENRKLRDEDFTNDAIDAGELGSGHIVTALYEIIPTGIKSNYSNAAPELKYSQPTATARQFGNELATIKFRSKKPDGDKSTEIVRTIPNISLPLQSTSGDYKFSAAVAWFGLKLRDSQLIPNKKTDDIKALAKQGLINDPDGYRAEFVRLVDMVQ